MAVAITRRDLSARELRLAASKAKDSSAARRMLAIALVLEGVARRSAAETCGICLLYTSDAADDLLRVDPGRRPNLKKQCCTPHTS